MGIPYSREINAALEQVTPLVASGYELIETVKNIALLILVIQIGIIALLGLNLVALLGLLFSFNPDLIKERQTLVTPVMKSIAKWTRIGLERKYTIAGLLIGFYLIAGLAYSAYVYHARRLAEDMAGEDAGNQEDQPEKDKEGTNGDGEDQKAAE